MLPALLATSTASDPMTAVLLIAVILFGFQVAISNIQTLPSDLFSGRSVGTVAGMGGTAAAIGVVLTTYVVPKITADSYAPFFLLGALLVPLGVACALAFAWDFMKAAPDSTQRAGALSRVAGARGTGTAR